MTVDELVTAPPRSAVRVHPWWVLSRHAVRARLRGTPLPTGILVAGVI